MKHIKKFLLFLILIFCLFVSSSLAVDINVHPNNTVENQSSNNTTNNSASNNTSNNEAPTNRTTSTPAVSTSSTSSRSDSKKLTLSDIIDIIVASIGIVNILLGIAIIIRFK